MSAKLVIENLRSFNRKERYYLVGLALGNTDFKLGSSFREELGRMIGIAVPQESFCAMDYHLDWIYASLYLPSSRNQMVFRQADKKLNENQQDIDLIIAFEKDEICNIILVEAKGVSNWTNKQLKYKADSLRTIFGDNGDKWRNVVVHFIIASPSKPQKLDVTSWPSWMISNGDCQWMKLELPEKLLKIARCDEGGNVNKEGSHWKIIPEKVRLEHR